MNNVTKKTIIIIGSSIIMAIVIVILLISPITKYLIEKYDEQYTGRQITTGWVYANPFTGYIHIGNLKIYESKSKSAVVEDDSVFFSAKGLSVNFALIKLLSKTIEISRLTLNRPRGIIIQNGNDFNFNDIIKKFTPQKSDSIHTAIHFNIIKIKIKNGEFYYREQITPINYFIKTVDFESSGKMWDADTIAVKFYFESGTGSGSVKGNVTINFKTLDYSLAFIVQNLDLNIIEQYLKDLANYGYFSAYLNADVQSQGNFKEAENVTNKGILAIQDFHFGKNKYDDYVSFDKLLLVIKEVSPKKHIYYYDSVTLSHPYLKYERYDYLDNLQMMFGKNGANISVAKADPAKFNLILEIADYIKVLAENFFKSEYMINELAISDGCLKFNDYSLSEKFSIETKPLFVFADSVNKNNKRVEILLKSGVQPYGNIFVALSINPNDSSDFDMQYHLQKLPIALLNPYMITYTSFPFDRGTIELTGTWKVRNGIIKSDNHLFIMDPRLADRLKNDGTKRIPSPLILYFIRESSNVIDYEIPISGNLKNPKFHLKDIIFDVLGNIFIKPPTIPYRTQVKNIENEIEKSLALKWEMRQNALLPDQEKFINNMADFLVSNTAAFIAVYPMSYAEKETEYIQFYEAKKKYYMASKNIKSLYLSEDDSLQIDKMSVKDTSFVKYLNKQFDTRLMFTIQEKCEKLIGSTVINAKLKQLQEERETAFMMCFKKKAVDARVKMYTSKNVIPYNGFSFYRIVYKGEFPETLTNAYLQMNELNNEAPRKLFKKERDKNKNTL